MISKQEGPEPVGAGPGRGEDYDFQKHNTTPPHQKQAPKDTRLSIRESIYTLAGERGHYVK